jgi:hypothetical protein
MKRKGKTEKTFYIIALIQSMKKNAFDASLTEQLRLFKELQKAGVFDVEGFNQRYRRGMEQHYRGYIDRSRAIFEKFDETIADAELLIWLVTVQKLAIALCRAECTCGAAEKHLAETEKFSLSILNLAQVEPGDCEDEGGECFAESGST